MKTKSVTLRIARKESDEARYRRIGKAINLRKNVTWAALHWYMDRQRLRQRNAVA